MLRAAEEWRQAVLKLQGRTADTPQITSPAMVTSAFCLEIYLKILIVIDSGSYPVNEHNLRKLFERLSLDLQLELRRIYDTDAGSLR